MTRGKLSVKALTPMTMPKKSRRSICVDGESFHWVERVMQFGHLTIQHASGAGSCLIVLPLDIMLPAEMADGIRYAKRSGWQPRTPDANVWIGFQLAEPRFRIVRPHSKIEYSVELRDAGIMRPWVLPEAIETDT